MTPPVLLLILLNFAAIGLLTLTFFFRRSKRLTVKWWATALPYFGCPVLLVVAYALDLDPTVPPGGWRTPADLVAVVLTASSIALMFYARGTHRIPLSHFHQPGDTPRHIVTDGAYRRIRHPFYTSYLLLFAAVVACFPHWVTLGVFGYVLVSLNLTAAAEERLLSASAFGAEYRAYLARTGRFLPRVIGRTEDRAADSDAPAAMEREYV